MWRVPLKKFTHLHLSQVQSLQVLQLLCSCCQALQIGICISHALLSAWHPAPMVTEAHVLPLLIMPQLKGRSGAVAGTRVLPDMPKSNCCTAGHCTCKWGLVAALEAEVTQWRTQPRQGIEHSSNEGAPSVLAANVTLRVVGTRWMWSLWCWRKLLHAHIRGVWCFVVCNLHIVHTLPWVKSCMTTFSWKQIGGRWERWKVCRTYLPIIWGDVLRSPGGGQILQLQRREVGGQMGCQCEWRIQWRCYHLKCNQILQAGFSM